MNMGSKCLLLLKPAEMMFLGPTNRRRAGSVLRVSGKILGNTYPTARTELPPSFGGVSKCARLELLYKAGSDR